MEGGWRNKIALPTMRALGIPVMNTWNSSATLWGYHYNYKVRSAQLGVLKMPGGGGCTMHIPFAPCSLALESCSHDQRPRCMEPNQACRKREERQGGEDCMHSCHPNAHQYRNLSHTSWCLTRIIVGARSARTARTPATPAYRTCISHTDRST